MQRKKRIDSRTFIPSASFLVTVVTAGEPFHPEIRVPGVHGYRGEPEIVVHASLSRGELILLLACGELLLPCTRN